MGHLTLALILTLTLIHLSGGTAEEWEFKRYIPRREAVTQGHRRGDDDFFLVAGGTLDLDD